MNLPTCPSCGQSVLDDDAQDCPFCGSSMKGGGGKTKKPAAATRSQPAASKKPPTADTTPGDGSDDPFAVNAGAAQKAVPVRPKPAQTHRFKVVCPMCDAVGFLPPSAAGQEVRCANAKCALPVFTAPEIKKKQAPAPAPPPAKTGSSKLIWIVLAIVVLVCASGAIWQLFLRDTDFTTQAVDYTPPQKQNDDDPQPDQTTADTTQPVQTDISLADLQIEILPLMAELSQVSEDNRSKPFCHRLTAESYALASRTSEAQSELEKLSRVGAEVPYYQVAPLVEIAWNELEANNPDAAGRTLDAAIQAASQLPPVGRYRLDAATQLASALVTVGRGEQAAQILVDVEEEGSLGRLSALVQTVEARGTFDLDSALSNEFWDAWEAPQWTAVALVLGAKGRWEESLQWCRRHPQSEKRIGCLVVWAEEWVTHAASQGVDPSGLIESAAADLTAAEKARLHARIAARQAVAGATAQADASLAIAHEALNSIEMPAPIKLTDMKDVYSRVLPDPTELRTAATAAVEIAFAEIQRERHDEAWNAMALALEFTRGLTPSPAATQKRLDELDRLGTRAASERLKTALELEGDAQAFRALQNYRSQCIKLNEAAQDRVQFQISLLAHACDWPLREELWSEIKSRSDDSDPDRQEPYLRSRLPWLLAAAYRASGQDQAAEQIEEVLSKLRQKPDPQLELIEDTTALIAEGSMLKATRAIDRSRLDKGWRQQWYLRLVCRLAGGEDIEPAYELARQAVDPTWGEEALRLVSARAVLTGREDGIWQTVKQRQLSPTDKIALCRGLMAGIASTDENVQ